MPDGRPDKAAGKQASSYRAAAFPAAAHLERRMPNWNGPYEYEGNVFKTLNDMAAHYGITRPTASDWIKRQRDLEKGIDRFSIGGYNRIQCEYEGRVFSSISALARHLGCSRGKAAELVRVRSRSRRNRTGPHEFDGRIFKTAKALAEHYGVRRDIARKWISDELTEPPLDYQVNKTPDPDYTANGDLSQDAWERRVNRDMVREMHEGGWMVCDLAAYFRVDEIRIARILGLEIIVSHECTAGPEHDIENPDDAADGDES